MSELLSDRLRNEIERLKLENEALRKDAERYRFLRDEDVNTDPKYYPFWDEFNVKLCREKQMDAVIDAALAAREGA